MNKWIELINKDDYIGVKQYLKKGADLEETNESGESILACAMRGRCDIDFLMLLIDNGADIFDFDEEGVSIFDMAITYDNIAMVKYLIEHGIDINQTKRRSGFTPLMAAVSYGRIEIVKILLENNVNQNGYDSKGFTAVDFARKMNKKSVLALLEYDENDPKNKTFAR